MRIMDYTIEEIQQIIYMVRNKGRCCGQWYCYECPISCDGSVNIALEKASDIIKDVPKEYLLEALIEMQGEN